MGADSAQNTRAAASASTSTSSGSKGSASWLGNNPVRYSYIQSNLENRGRGRSHKRKVQDTGSDPAAQREHPHVDQHNHSTDGPDQDGRKRQQFKRMRLTASAGGEKRLRRSVSMNTASNSLLILLLLRLLCLLCPELPADLTCSVTFRFREKAPASFAAVYERATTQRFFVLSRTMCGTDYCPEMHLEVSGSTGNIYNVCIARQPTCDCPHARAGNQCKHTIFVLKKVLRARHHYVYQLALLSDELRDIFANCPPNPADDQSGSAAANDKNRKPVDGGDCPICFEIMESGPRREALVWCKAACGQNIHRQCFDMWLLPSGSRAATAQRASSPVRTAGAPGRPPTRTWTRSSWPASREARPITRAT